MRSSLAALLATTSLLFATECQKHQDPLGTVPADDVPAVPTGAQTQGVAGSDGAGDASACERETGAEREATLVYPKDASATEGRISILAPVGAALIGLRAGDSIDWPMPNGRSKRLRIVSVLWQPEAAGEFEL